MLAYTGIETISNMSEEARDEARTIPAAINRVRIAVFAIYFTLPAVALSALPVQQRADGTYYTLLGLPEEEGGFAGDPILGFVKQIDLGPLQGPGELYVGLLAATILFLATNAGIIGVSRLVYSMGIHRQLPDGLRRLHPRFRTPWVGILVFSALAIAILLPGQEAFLGSIYSFGALLSFTIAHAAVARLRAKLPDVARPYRGPGNVRIGGYDAPLFALVGGTFTGGRVRRHRGAEPHRGGGRRRLAAARDRRLLPLPPPPGARPAIDAQGRDPAAGGRPRGRVRLRARAAARRPLRRARARHRGQARGAQAARDPRAVAGHGAERAADRRTDGRRGGAPPQSAIEQARVQGGRRVSGHTERIRAGQAGRRIIDDGDQHARRRDRDAAPAAGGRGLALRPDAGDGADRAPVPGDHRDGRGRVTLDACRTPR